MTTKRELKKRLAHVEAEAERRSSPTTDEVPPESIAQAEEIIDSLDDEARAELEKHIAEMEQEPADAETDEFGLTDAKAACYDVLTGHRP